MLCQTIKKDKDCYFWGDEGCSFTEGHCHVIVDKCEGCSRTEPWPTGSYCTSYPAPEKHWKVGLCNMATHIKVEEEKQQKMLNPLKASKRKVGR